VRGELFDVRGELFDGGKKNSPNNLQHKKKVVNVNNSNKNIASLIYTLIDTKNREK
jgi:hypothetical protein